MPYHLATVPYEIRNAMRSLSFSGAGDEARLHYCIAEIKVALRPAVARNSPPDCCIKSFEPAGSEFEIGAGDEARTRYLHLGKVALYRMSYTRISVPEWEPWCLRSESNQRHADFQSAALPTELQRHIVESKALHRCIIWRPGTDSNRRPPA